MNVLFRKSLNLVVDNLLGIIIWTRNRRNHGKEEREKKISILDTTKTSRVLAARKGKKKKIQDVRRINSKPMLSMSIDYWE